MRNLRENNKQTVCYSVSVFLIALSLRAGFVLETAGLPSLSTFTSSLDAALYWRAADYLITDSPPKIIFELQLASSPLFAYFLAGAKSVFGNSILTIRLLLAVIGSFTAVLVFLLARHFSGKVSAGFFAACFYAILPSLIYFDSFILKVSLELFLLTGLLYLLALSLAEKEKKKALLWGVFCGVLVCLLNLSQLNTFLYAPCLAFAVLLNRRQELNLRLLIVLPVLALSLIVSLLFHSRADLPAYSGKHYLPQSGIHIRLGFNKDATGHYRPHDLIPGNPLGHSYFGRMLAEDESGRRMTPGEADKHHRDKALEFIFQNKSQAFSLMLKKAFLFFNNLEMKGNHFLPSLMGHSNILYYSPLSYGIVLIFAVLGIWSFWEAGNKQPIYLSLGIVLPVLFSCLVTFVTFRYRLHSLIPLLILSGEGLAYLSRNLQNYKIFLPTKKALSLALVLGLTCLLTFSDPGVNTEGMLKRGDEIITDAEELEKQRIEYLQSQQQEPDQELRKLKEIQHLRTMWRLTDFYQLLQKARLEYPNNVELAGLHFEYLVLLGDYEGAKELFAEFEDREDLLLDYLRFELVDPLIQQKINKYVL